MYGNWTRSRPGSPLAWKVTYGYAKQGAGYGYSGVKGLNALIATVSTEATAPAIIATRPRKGSANSARGAARLVAEAIKTTRSCGVAGLLVRRGDSAYYNRDVISSARRHDAATAFTLTHAAGSIASTVHAKATTATLRAQLIDAAARVATSARCTTLHPTDRMALGRTMAAPVHRHHRATGSGLNHPPPSGPTGATSGNAEQTGNCRTHYVSNHGSKINYT